MSRSRILLPLASAVALALFALPVTAVVTQTSSPNAPLLPDNGCVDDGAGTGLGGITDAIVFTETGTISDVNVSVEITHTWRADLQASVSYSEGGGTVMLMNNHDTSGDNYFATFDSDAALACSDATMCGLTTGSPCETAPGPVCQPNASLDAFDGFSAPGTFTLTMCDRAAADTGTLVAWSVTLDGDGDLPVELSGFSIE